ncbi:hypothetical protein [Hyalangium sp.]|uniref:hypothetical protein n=1 Tax=Hyalangium sp. TaxID=2028555 RepID=UPI002D624373|nr:hypothetical protein [Hyalangium sp.]HYI01974.1 hypothetical protein [Hyalangium sp.]
MPIEVTGLAELVRTLEEARRRAPHAYQLDGSPGPVGNRTKYLSFRFSTSLGPQVFSLASDTHMSAIDTFLALARRARRLEDVLELAKTPGGNSKLVLRTAGRIEGWYCYAKS